MKMGNIDYLFSNGKSGFRNCSKLEYEVYNLYLNDKDSFNRLLMEVKNEYN